MRHVHNTVGRDGCVLHDYGQRIVGKQNHWTDDTETRGVDKIEEKSELLPF